MKTTKKVLALLLGCALVLSMTACSSLSAAKTVRKLGKLDSYHADLDLDLGIGLDMSGEKIPLDFDFGISADCNAEPFCGEGEMRTVIADESETAQLYFIREDDSFDIYTSSDNGESWTKRSISLDASRSGLGLNKETLSFFSKISSTFQETGAETINGYQATVYSGEISGELLRSMLEEGGFAESISEALDLEPGTLTLDEVSSIPVTVAVDDKSDLPVRITADLSGLMQSLFPFFLQAVAQSAAKEDGEQTDTEELLSLFSMMQVSFDRFTVSLELKDFDAVGEITIPEEVIDTAEAA